MFESKYNEYLSAYTQYAEQYCQNLVTEPAILGESMKYSLLGGGKRIRPVLLLATADVLNVPIKDVLPYALALEMIHTYSLIHDDLPAMDNDDFRRGKPSNHKVYGEGNAILAGDGLLNTAFSLCLEQCIRGEQFILASKYLAECAGINGMIAGQSADLLFTAEKSETELTEENLWFIYERKTGKLLLAPVAIACILANNKNYFEFEQFGKYLGMLFQITDDILDETSSLSALGKSVGKDKEADKFTSVRLYGLDGANIRADLCAQNCHAVLDGIDGDVSFLHELIKYVREREK